MPARYIAAIAVVILLGAAWVALTCIGIANATAPRAGWTCAAPAAYAGAHVVCDH